MLLTFLAITTSLKTSRICKICECDSLNVLIELAKVVVWLGKKQARLLLLLNKIQQIILNTSCFANSLNLDVYHFDAFYIFFTHPRFRRQVRPAFRSHHLREARRAPSSSAENTQVWKKINILR